MPKLGQHIWKNRKHPMLGKHHSKKSKQKISKSKKGKSPAWNKDKKGMHLSPKSEFKKGCTAWNKGKICSYLQGKNCGKWKGGKNKTSQGYIVIYQPNHPFAKRRYVLRSRLVMEKHLGRYLKPEEVVHHNGTKYPMGSLKDRQDDRIENLILFANNSDHKKFPHLPHR